MGARGYSKWQYRAPLYLGRIAVQGATIKRSNRKTLALEVRDGRVIVRAPYGLAQGSIDAFIAQKRAWIEKHVQNHSKRQSTYPEPTPEQLDALTQLARIHLPDRVQVFAKCMGVSPSRVNITRAKTRFGSCSAKNSINFSCLLMRYPQEAIDYVIVHELAHILHKNHSAQFYQCIGAVLPDYKSRIALLKG